MADPSSPMSMLSEQLEAASRAWIPLLLLMLVIAVGMWRILEWIYRAVLRKRQELYEMSRLEVELLNERATRTAEELTEKAKQDEQKEEPLSRVDQLERDRQIKKLTLRLIRELDQLGQANNSGPTGPRGPLRYPPPSEIVTRGDE